MDGCGYNDDGILDKDILTKMLNREEFWIKTLRTFYPYELNGCKRKSSNFAIISSLYFANKR